MTIARNSWKLITAGRLIDGRGGLAVENGAVLVEGSKIHQVGPAHTVELPEGVAATEYAYPGMTVLPGLVDTHVHLNLPGDGTPVEEGCQKPDGILVLQSAWNARKALESGVTTLRDLGAKGRTTFELREGVCQGLVQGPRLLLCGRPVTRTGGHCWVMGEEADGVDGVRRAVRRLVKDGADFIKVMTTGGDTRGTHPARAAYSVEELRAIVEEAHRLGRPTAFHCTGTEGVVASLAAGADTLIHGAFRDPDGTYRFQPKVADQIAKAGLRVNPTIHSLRIRVQQMEEQAQAAGLEGQAVEEFHYLGYTLSFFRRYYQERLDNGRRLIQAGVKLVAGSDSGWGHHPVGQFPNELETMVLAGLTPMEAVLSATHDAAEVAGVLDQVGTLEAGKVADILVVDGDPIQEIMALEKVVAVFHCGGAVGLG